MTIQRHLVKDQKRPIVLATPFALDSLKDDPRLNYLSLCATNIMNILHIRDIKRASGTSHMDRAITKSEHPGEGGGCSTVVGIIWPPG